MFQVKTDSGLLEYPIGRSAMFYYGYANQLDFGLREFRSNILPGLGQDERSLRVRWLTTDDTMGPFKRYINKFYRTFGSLPAGNETKLLKDRQSRVSHN